MRNTALSLCVYAGSSVGILARVLPKTAKRAVTKALHALIEAASGKYPLILYIFSYETVKQMYRGAETPDVLTRVFPTGFSMELDVTKKTQRILYLQKIYEPYLSRYMQNNLAQGDIFIDIGANVGYYTLLAAQLVGSEGQVLAFEPETENYKALMGNVRRNGFKNITAVNKATGASSGPATLYLNPLNEGGHSLRRFDAYHDNNETWSRERILKQFPKAALEESVMVVSLDSFLEQTDVKKKVPRIVKIDVEGGEFDVLRGMTGLLRKMDAPDIICEVGRNSAEIIEILQSYNYTLSTLNNDGTTVPYRRSAGVKIKGLLAAKRRD